MHLSEKLNRIKRARAQYVAENGHEPAVRDIAKMLHLNENKVNEIIRASQNPVSLETPLGEEEDSCLRDIIKDETQESPEEAVGNILLHEDISKMLDTLTEREAEVIRLRYGLKDGKRHTLEDIGNRLYVTRERVRQIEVIAIRKLRRVIGLRYSGNAE